MSSNLPSGAQVRTRNDSIKLLYKDGLLPVAHAKAVIVALGQNSYSRSYLPDEDFEAWVGKTDGNGEVWLASPELMSGMELLAQKIKRLSKSQISWYYDPKPANRAQSPNIPLMIRIDDEAVAAPTLEIELTPQTFTTLQARPPIGEIDGKTFMDPTAFVQQLSQRLSRIGRDRSAVSLKLTRCGSPAPSFMLRSAWTQLDLALGTSRSDYTLTTAYVKKFKQVRDHVWINLINKILTDRQHA